jgi:hypothetical protein
MAVNNPIQEINQMETFKVKLETLLNTKKALALAEKKEEECNLLKEKIRLYEKECNLLKEENKIYREKTSISELAQKTAQTIKEKVIPERWKQGVNILFENTVSSEFFEAFQIGLQGIEEVEIFVNSTKKILKVELPGRAINKFVDNLFITVFNDGKFTFTNTNLSDSPSSKTVTLASLIKTKLPFK